MKKILALVLTLVLLASMSLPAMAENLPFDPYEEEITLYTVRTMHDTVKFDENNPATKSFRENVWVDAIKENLNINLDYSWIAANEEADNSKWAAGIATGNVPDFAVVSPQTYKLLLESDLVADCSEIYNQYVSDEFKALLDDALVGQLKVGDKLMGLPYPTVGYLAVSNFYVRQDWLDKLNLQFPTNYEEIVNVAKAFKEAKLGGEDTIPFLFATNGDNGRLDGFFNMFGAYLNYWVKKDGKVTYSNIQPEMRTALLEMQKLYNEGLINKDFVITTSDLGMEYVSSGKAGMFFGISWATTGSIQTLLNNDPEARISSSCIFGADGSDIQFQTATPVASKIFVSKNCEHPEAVGKLMSLVYRLIQEDYSTYGTDANGMMRYKYIPFSGDMPVASVDRGPYDVELAYEKYLAGEITQGSDYTWPDNAWIGRFDRYVKAMKGESTEIWMPLTYGKDGTYTKLYKAYLEGRHLPNAYVGLPTETQSMMGDVLTDALYTAIYEVIMGADISVFDNACEEWLSSGGQDIIDEINDALGL